MPIHGYNISATMGNGKIPYGYIFNPAATSWADVVLKLGFLLRTTRPKVLRMILWHAERDPEYTPWLHIPVSEEEVERICGVVGIVKPISPETRVRLVNGPLWEALPWLNEQLKEPIHPNNPFETAEELSGAMTSSIRNIVNGLDDESMESVEFDLWNEFDFSTQPQNAEVMRLYYPAVSEFLSSKEIPYTVSTIMDTDGSMVRADKTYDFLMTMDNFRYLSFLEVHMNGILEGKWKLANLNLCVLQRKYQRNISIGEIDVETTMEQEQELTPNNISDIIYWR
jgi:hypothetical protein